MTHLPGGLSNAPGGKGAFRVRTEHIPRPRRGARNQPELHGIDLTRALMRQYLDQEWDLKPAEVASITSILTNARRRDVFGVRKSKK